MINRIHGGNCLKRDIVDFSVNTNPLGLPEGIADIVSENTDAILRYPDPSSEQLKKRLSVLHGAGPERITVGNGSMELIYIIPRALKIKKSLIVIPTFSEYEFALKLNNSKPIFFKTKEKDDFRISHTEIAGYLPQSGALFLCNPNNPTGSLLRSDEILQLLRICKNRGAILILDEAFIEFTEESENTAIVSEAIKNRSLVILRSLTKFFAIPGLRLGYAIGHKMTIEKIAKFQYPWNVNGLAQLVGEKVLTDKDYMDRTRLFVAEERQYIVKKLKTVKGLKTYPSSANFILCKLQNTQIKSSTVLTGHLLRDCIYIRGCENFRGLNDRFFRIAVRKRHDNNRLINSIEKALR